MVISKRWLQRFWVAIAVTCLLFSSSSWAADPPEIIHFEGYLTNSQGVPLSDGHYDVVFRLYDTATGGTALWTETWNGMQVTKGRFRVMLGTHVPLTTAFFQQHPTTYIGITVGAETEMLPRQRIASVPYALSSPGNAVPSGGIIMWSGAINAIPEGWALCDGNNGTPNLRDRFIVSVGNGYNVGAIGGVAAVTLSINQIPSHNHSGTTGGQTANHTHTGMLISKNEDGTSGTRVREASNSGATGGVSYQTNGPSNDHQHPFSTSSIGGGGSHENRPPYYALAFIMKL